VRGHDLTAILASGQHLVPNHQPGLAPAQDRRLDPERLERAQLAAEADHAGIDHRHPAMPQHRPPQPRAEHQVGAAEIHQRPVAAVVHVQRGVEIMRPDAKAQPRGIGERFQPRTKGARE
jgi:hypothetical protein